MKPFAQLVGKTMQVVISYACSSSYYLPNGLLNLTTRYVKLKVGFIHSAPRTAFSTPLSKAISSLIDVHTGGGGGAATRDQARGSAEGIKSSPGQFILRGRWLLLAASVIHHEDIEPSIGDLIAGSLKMGIISLASNGWGSLLIAEVNRVLQWIKLIQPHRYLRHMGSIPPPHLVSLDFSDKERNDAELKSHEFQGMVLHRDGNIKLFMREFERVSKERGELQKQVLSLEHEVVRGCRVLRLLPNISSLYLPWLRINLSLGLLSKRNLCILPNTELASESLALVLSLRLFIQLRY
ncbi:hypothetical protein Tco_0612642 [Tanacetum coccineum]